jgi:hypothetical protein
MSKIDIVKLKADLEMLKKELSLQNKIDVSKLQIDIDKLKLYNMRLGVLSMFSLVVPSTYSFLNLPPFAQQIIVIVAFIFLSVFWYSLLCYEQTLIVLKESLIKECRIADNLRSTIKEDINLVNKLRNCWIAPSRN